MTKKYNWTIDKEFHFEAGHRVWAQKLPHQHLSITTDCACRHIHGHSYTIKVFLGANDLDQSAMVTDFKNLNFMKEFVDNVLDHRCMLDIDDPNFTRITGVQRLGGAENFTNLGQLFPSDDPDEQVHRDSFVLVNFVPTSENICRYLKQYAQERLGDVAKVTALELWETKKSHCRYEGDE